MKTLIRTLLLPIVSIVLAGCGLYSGYGVAPANPNPNLTSFTDPAFVGRHFGRIAIVADTADLDWRHRLERQLAEKLRVKGGDAREGYTFFPPTRPWTQSEKLSAMIAGGAEAYLTVTIDTLGAETRWVPETTSTTVARERNVKDTVKPGPGRDTTQSETWREKHTTQVEGGYNVTTPWARFRITLVEAATGRVAWLAITTIQGKAADGIGTFSERVAAQLVYDGMMRKVGT